MNFCHSEELQEKKEEAGSGHYEAKVLTNFHKHRNLVKGAVRRRRIKERKKTKGGGKWVVETPSQKKTDRGIERKATNLRSSICRQELDIKKESQWVMCTIEGKSVNGRVELSQEGEREEGMRLKKGQLGEVRNVIPSLKRKERWPQREGGWEQLTVLERGEHKGGAQVKIKGGEIK